MKRTLVIGVPLIAAGVLAFVAVRPSKPDVRNRSTVRPIATGEETPSPSEPSKPAAVPERRADECRSTAMLLGAEDPERIARFPVPDLLRRIRMLARDPEMLSALRSLVDSWRTSADSSVRLRGEVLFATLEGSWAQAAQTHPDPEVRTALLESPPDREAATLEVLISAAEREAAGTARKAALHGLPTELGAAQVRRLASRLRFETDGAVRRELIEVLPYFKEADRSTVEALKAIAFSATDERDAAQAALLKFADDHPGVLSRSEEEALQQAMLNPATSP